MIGETELNKKNCLEDLFWKDPNSLKNNLDDWDQ